MREIFLFSVPDSEKTESQKISWDESLELTSTWTLPKCALCNKNLYLAMVENIYALRFRFVDSLIACG